MKKYILLCFVLLTSSSLLAQISEGGVPPSFRYINNARSLNVSLEPHIFEPEDNIARLKWEDSIVDKNGGPTRIATIIPASIDLARDGEWSILSDGQKICRIVIQSPKAEGIILSYSHFEIPEGGKLFIYDTNKDQILGAYTQNTNPSGKEFSTEIVYSDELILEYADPGNGTNANIKISGVGYAYNITKKATGFGTSAECEVDINCSEGANWQRQKRGVAKTLTIIGNMWYACSGTLINNTNEDFTPYYLSAYHCFFTSVDAADFSSMQFYFHYEKEGCNNPSETEAQVNARTKSLIGAQLLVANPIYGGLDGALLKLNSNIPDNYDLVFNGWDINTTAASSGVGIHHPSADVKKISTYSQALRSGTYIDYDGSGAQNAHWLARFAATANGYGITEQGSSGSPLFNQDGRVVGTLTGGSTTCINPNTDDYYSKFYYQWDKGSDPSGRQMKDYLDPSNKGVQRLDLIAQLPDINVNADTINIKEGHSFTVNILSGNGGYSTESSNEDIVTATQPDASNSFVISGISQSQGIITIRDAKNKKTKILVNVYSKEADPIAVKLIGNILSINLMTDSNDYISVVNITDMWGRVVYSDNNLKNRLLHQIDTSTIGKGVFIVKMKTNRGYIKAKKLKW